ncbi:alpha-L-rhamnosidase N- domain protein, partial [mine drainage metagenome]
GVLTKGRHVLAVQVLYFGTGDGTYPMGSPGLLLRLDLDMLDGSRRRVVTDHSWQTYLDRGHRPGMYKRWFLRALQEDFDARLHPWGWDLPGFEPEAGWLPAMELPGRPDKPAIFAGGPGICPLIRGGSPHARPAGKHCGPRAGGP